MPTSQRPLWFSLAFCGLGSVLGAMFLAPRHYSICGIAPGMSRQQVLAKCPGLRPSASGMCLAGGETHMNRRFAHFKSSMEKDQGFSVAFDGHDEVSAVIGHQLERDGVLFLDGSAKPDKLYHELGEPYSASSSDADYFDFAGVVVARPDHSPNEYGLTGRDERTQLHFATRRKSGQSGNDAPDGSHRCPVNK